MKTIPLNELQLIDIRHGSPAEAWRTVKQAAGPTSNTQYEKALSTIGMTILQDRASDLLPYLAGFQLLDRAEDGEFAAGFFVFDANGLIVDAPLFMISGKIKGQQILFVRNSGVFVPSRDGVIRYLLSRQRQNIGEPGPGQGEPRPMRASPDIGVFSTNNRFLAKQAKAPAHFSHWAKQAGLVDSVHSIYHNPDTFGAMAAFKENKFGSGLLEMALRIPGARSKLASWCRQSPVIHDRVTRVLGPAENWATEKPTLHFGDGSFQIRSKRAEAPTAEQDTVSLYTQPPVDAADDKREKMIGEILMLGFSAEDRRKASDMNKAIQVVDADGWACPSDSGIYDVIDPEGEKHRSMVFIGRDRFNNSNGSMLVIRTSDNHVASVLDGDLAVPATAQLEPSKTLKDIYDKLPDFSLSSVKDDDCFVVISPEGLLAGPFHARGTASDGVLAVRNVRVENQSERPSGSRSYYSCNHIDYMLQREDYTVFEKIDFMREPAIIVPMKSKIISLPKLSDDDPNVWGGDPKEFRVLALSAIDFRKLNQRVSVKIARFSDKMVKLNDMPLTNRQAGWVLIKQAGLPAKFVTDLLGSLGESPMRYAIVPSDVQFEPWQLATSKVAIAQGPLVPQNMTDMQFDVPQPVQGNEPDWFQTPSQEVTTDAVFSPMQYGDPTSPKANPMYAGYNGPQVSGNHDPGAGKGPEEDSVLEDISETPEKLFQNKTFMALLRKARVDTEISKYVEALFKMCDQTGRILFLIYAHPDEFADFYGEKDVDTLEEQLLTMFESGGDLLAELLEQSAGTSDNITLASLDQAT